MLTFNLVIRILLKGIMLGVLPCLAGKLGAVITLVCLGFLTFRFLHRFFPQRGHMIYRRELTSLLLTYFVTLLALYSCVRWPIEFLHT